jgi:hypothetical protein
MIDRRKIEQVSEACLVAYETLKRHGTPEMQATMRILLFQIGREVARQQPEQRTDLDS